MPRWPCHPVVQPCAAGEEIKLSVTDSDCLRLFSRVAVCSRTSTADGHGGSWWLRSWQPRESFNPKMLSPRRLGAIEVRIPTKPSVSAASSEILSRARAPTSNQSRFSQAGTPQLGRFSIWDSPTLKGVNDIWTDLQILHRLPDASALQPRSKAAWELRS